MSVTSKASILAFIALNATICWSQLDEECTALLDEWERTEGAWQPTAAHGLYFMHIPRTAGKTLYQCVLKTAVPPSQRCVKAYDGPRLKLNNPACRLLSSHDDYRLAQDLPGLAPVTALRRAVDRVLSSYEFSVTQAALGLDGSMARKNETEEHHLQVETTKVWPWSALIPWIQDDMRQRLSRLQKAAALSGDQSPWVRFKTKQGTSYWWNRETNVTSTQKLPVPPSLDPYNNPLAMPLHEWVEQPMVLELVHNGSLFQMLGLTGTQHSAAHLRRCFRIHDASRQRLLNIAKARIASMPAVGISERLNETAAAFVRALGISWEAPAYRNQDEWAVSFDPESGEDLARMLVLPTLGELTLGEARRKLIVLHKSMVQLHEKLAVLEPLLQIFQHQPQRRSSLQNALAEQDSAQKQLVSILRDMEALASAGAITRLGGAQGHSVQIMPDEHYLLPEPLGPAFLRCLEGQRGEGTYRTLKREGFAALHLPLTRESFCFEGGFRKKLGGHLLSRIGELNAGDDHLYQLVSERLGKQIQEAGGTHLPLHIQPLLHETVEVQKGHDEL